jgi:hypothetical protein
MSGACGEKRLWLDHGGYSLPNMTSDGTALYGATLIRATTGHRSKNGAQIRRPSDSGLLYTRVAMIWVLRRSASLKNQGKGGWYTSLDSKLPTIQVKTIRSTGNEPLDAPIYCPDPLYCTIPSAIPHPITRLELVVGSRQPGVLHDRAILESPNIVFSTRAENLVA